MAKNFWQVITEIHEMNRLHIIEWPIDSNDDLGKLIEKKKKNRQEEKSEIFELDLEKYPEKGTRDRAASGIRDRLEWEYGACIINRL